MKIIDQSYPALGITVNFSAENPANLPNVISTHDIISLHHVMIKINDGNYYSNYDNRYSSFALFEESQIGELVPYQSTCKYSGTRNDTIFLKFIREWSNNRKIYQVLTEPVKMMRIDPCAIFDLICEVLYVSKSLDNEWILHVWDGTNAPSGLQWIQRKSKIEFPQIPLQIEETPVPRDILCTFPCTGTILRVFSKRNFIEIPNLQANINNNNININKNNNNCWVRLCNMTCTMHETCGIWEGSLEPFSKIQILSDEDMYVKNQMREYENRMIGPAGRYPWLCLPCFHSIAVTDFPYINYSTLMDSLTSKQVPHQIKCIARVVDINPSQIEYWRSPFILHHEIKLTLEDPTARIHAYLTYQHAERFFGDYSEEVLKQKMKILLGENEWEAKEGFMSIRDPPTLGCFLLEIVLFAKRPLRK